MKRLLFILTFLLLLPYSVFGATYYVDSSLSGNCTGTTYSIANRNCTGSDGYGYKTFNTPNANATAPSTIYIRSGTYTLDGSAQGIKPANSGTSDSNKIVYQTYSNETATINASIKSGYYGIEIDTKNWIKVSGYDGSTSTKHLVVSNLLAHLNISNASYNEISYVTFSGSFYDSLSPAPTLWQSSYNYSLGDMVHPTNDHGFYYVVTTDNGSSGSSEPSWGPPPYDGGTVNDGNIVWTANIGSGYRMAWIHGTSQYNWIYNCSFSNFSFYGLNDDGGCLLDIGWDDGRHNSNYNVIENNDFFHGSHHLLGVNSAYNVVRNNTLSNEQWRTSSLDNIYHSHRLMYLCMDFPDFNSNDGWSLIEYNTFAHGGQPISQQNPGEAINLIENYVIIRHNSFYAQPGHSIIFNRKTYPTVKANHIYNNTFFAGGYGATLPSNYYYPTWPGRDSNDRRAVAMATGPGDNGNNDYTRVFNNVFKNNLFYKWYDSTGLEQIRNSDYNVAMYSFLGVCSHVGNYTIMCPNTYVYGDAVFGNNFNNYGTNTDPKFVSEGSYGSPSVNAADKDWYWGSYSPDGTDIRTISGITQPDLRLKYDSPAINGGTYLTTAVYKDSNEITVNDAKYFQPGWGKWPSGGPTVYGDQVCLTTSATTVSYDNCFQISSIDYTNNYINIGTHSLPNDATTYYIWLYKNSSGTTVLAGTAPDQGAYEYTSSPSATGCTISGGTFK